MLRTDLEAIHVMAKALCDAYGIGSTSQGRLGDPNDTDHIVPNDVSNTGDVISSPAMK
jgi:hypothetical protein